MPTIDPRGSLHHLGGHLYLPTPSYKLELEGDLAIARAAFLQSLASILCLNQWPQTDEITHAQGQPIHPQILGGESRAG